MVDFSQQILLGSFGFEDKVKHYSITVVPNLFFFYPLHVYYCTRKRSESVVTGLQTDDKVVQQPRAAKIIRAKSHPMLRETPEHCPHIEIPPEEQTLL